MRVHFVQGFEPRGTYIGVRQSSLSELQENTGPGKTLSPLPQQLSERSDIFILLYKRRQAAHIKQ